MLRSSTMSADSELQQLQSQLPKGSFWVTDKGFRRLIDILLRDRVRAGTNIKETPQAGGRFFHAQAGGGAVAHTLQLRDATEIDEAGAATYYLRVTRGQIAGQVPAVFSLLDNPVYKFVVSGDGVVYAEVPFTPSTGVVGAPTIEHAASMPASTSTAKRLTLGTFSVKTASKRIEVANDIYGPIQHKSCRQWGETTKTFELSLWGQSQ